MVELFKFEVADDERKILIIDFVRGKDKMVELPKAKLAYKKIADGVYEVSPSAQLEGGEYVFLVNRPNVTLVGAANSASLIGYCFNVKG